MALEQLQALGNMTQEIDSDNPDQATQQQAAQDQAEASEQDAGAKQWGLIMFTIGGFAQMIAPELKPVYSEDRCFQWGQQAQAVAAKHGWDGPGAMPELALIASTAGFMVPTYLIVRQKIELAKTAKDGTLAERLSAWWANRKAQRAAKAGAPGEVVGEAGGNGQQ